MSKSLQEQLLQAGLAKPKQAKKARRDKTREAQAARRDPKKAKEQDQLSREIAAKDAADTLLPRPGSASDGDVRIAMAAYNNMVNAGQYFENVTGIKRNRKYQGQQSYWETADE